MYIHIYTNIYIYIYIHIYIYIYIYIYIFNLLPLTFVMHRGGRDHFGVPTKDCTGGVDMNEENAQGGAGIR